MNGLSWQVYIIGGMEERAEVAAVLDSSMETYVIINDGEWR